MDYTSDATDGPLRVLLVEDDDGDAFLVRELLTDVPTPVDVTHVRSMTDMGGYLADVDCVLLDLGLPDAHDLDALTRTIAAEPDVPILVLTGLDDTRRALRAVALGAQDYILKGSVNGLSLLRAIRYAIERKRTELLRRDLRLSESLAEQNSRLQRGLLPSPMINDPCCTWATVSRPGARQALLGGDFYDLVERPDGELFGLIGDVSGHGPDEAALGVALRIAWRTLVRSGLHPADMLAALEDVLIAERWSEDVFATVAMVRAPATRTRIDLWSAGHPAPIMGTQSGHDAWTLQMDRPGLPIGLLPGSRWDAQSFDVPVAWWLLLYSDGIIEGYESAASHLRARLGIDGLIAALRDQASIENDDERLAKLLSSVEERNGGELTDDTALLLIRCHEKQPA
jgi:serine phosphatase RsbU (regulator of sigma subunit)